MIFLHHIRIKRAFLHQHRDFLRVAPKTILLMRGWSQAGKKFPFPVHIFSVHRHTEIAMLFWNRANKIKKKKLKKALTRFLKIVTGTGYKFPLKQFYASRRRRLIWQNWVLWRSKLIVTTCRQAEQDRQVEQGRQAGQTRQKGKQGNPLAPFWQGTQVPAHLWPSQLCLTCSLSSNSSAMPEIFENAFVLWEQSLKHSGKTAMQQSQLNWKDCRCLVL